MHFQANVLHRRQADGGYTVESAGTMQIWNMTLWAMRPNAKIYPQPNDRRGWC